jgi:hypothetical protein
MTSTHDAEQAGGESLPEERHGLEAEVIRISRGRKAGTEAF